MRPILMFILESCPYCQQALLWMAELKRENTSFANLQINIIDEQKNPSLANQYDYYYVPSFYIEGMKVHEGVATRDIIRTVFTKALQ